MPEMNGLETACEIRRLVPVPKLILMSSVYMSEELPFPLAEINVITAGQTRTAVAKRKSDKTGRFQFFDLKPGKYTLTASLEGFSGLSETTFWITPGSTTTVEWEMVARGKGVAVNDWLER